VLVALGMKKVLEYVGGASDHDLSDPLATLPLCIMYGGVAIYLLAHVGFKYRNWRTVSIPRVVATGAIVVGVPPATRLPALGALGLLTAVMVGLIAFEAVTFSELRGRVRHEDGGADPREAPPTPAL